MSIAPEYSIGNKVLLFVIGEVRKGMIVGRTEVGAPDHVIGWMYLVRVSGGESWHTRGELHIDYDMKSICATLCEL